MPAHSLQNARYLLAELGVLATVLRNPRSSLTRAQLAALAKRARHDAEALTGCDVAPIAAPVRASHAPVSAKIIPLFDR